MSTCTYLAALIAALGSAALGGGPSELFLIDFEAFPEGTEISTQYDALGVTFSIPDSKLLPVIALEGSPVVAFTGGGADNPMSSGSGGLTDPVIGNDTNAPNDILLTFDPPITSIRLFIIDIDGSDTMTLRAFDGAAEVAAVTHAAGDPGTGNGTSTEFFVSSEQITSVLVDVPASGTVGWAMDFITFTRPCPGICGKQIRVSQESAPGAGDFADQVLGFVTAYPSFGTTATEFYGYNIPEGDSWNGPLLTPVADRSHLVFAETLEGLTLFVVHDRAIPNDPDGGDAEMRFEFINDADGGEILVRDDPGSPDTYTGEPGELVFMSHHDWSPCCTDGLALTGLDCEGSLEVAFTDVHPSSPTIGGLTEWVAYSADGTQIALDLVEDRRVRFDVVPPPSCAADLNCTGAVDPADLAILLGAWGPNRGDLADLDGDGEVGPADLAVLLSQWGLCQ
ncbi:MAG: hypothetical protein KDA25_11845 [Phycisphaerales bacterium]|nr:hypothetical protein [Phycisphaerales bacterium]